MLVNAHMAGDRDELAEHRAHAQLHGVHLHHIGGCHRPGLHAIGTEALGQRFAHRAAGNGQHGVPRGGGFGQKLRIAQQPLAP